jgi:two-component system, OmpR family, alkaline phosphatase synthesis response regulator PhoP
VDTPETAKPIRVLLVEDQPTIARMTTTLLNNEGYVVTVVRNHAAALMQLMDPSIDLVLADTEGGARATDLEALAPLVSAAGARPVLLFSAHRFPESAAVEAGLAGYVRKPFDIDELLRAMRRALQAN